MCSGKKQIQAKKGNYSEGGERERRKQSKY